MIDLGRKAVVGPARRTAIGFAKGISYPFRGARFVYKDHPGLARYWIGPILITAAALALILVGSLSLHDRLVGLVWSTPTDPGFWGGLARVLHTFVSFLLALVVAVLGVVALTFFTSIFTAPFNDLLSEEVEKLVTGAPGLPFSMRLMIKGTVRGLRIELTKMLVYVFVMGSLFLLSWFLPVIGQGIYTVVGFLLSAVFFSVDYIDWPASRRDRGLGYRVGMLRRHFWPMLGFGTGVWLFLFLPFVNLLFVPAAVAGGTLLFLDLEGEVKPS